MSRKSIASGFSTPEAPRRGLLVMLLEAHERSASYGRPGPWPRDVIVKLDAVTFPESFSPEGREARAALFATAVSLEREGSVRIGRHPRGPLWDEPMEIRLGPAEVVSAYEAAEALGFEPLAVGLRAVERHVRELVQRPTAGWMHEHLHAIARGTREADLRTLGMARVRFKRQWRELLSALTAAAGLAAGIAPAWERVISERLLGDSKLLARLRPLVIDLLVRADPRWEGLPADDSADLLDVYGVRRKPGLIRCAGAVPLRVGGGLYRMEDFVPVAHLPLTWAEAWVDGLVEADIRQVTTIENEYSFLAYVEESGGPAGLGAQGELVVYTAGFPDPALTTTLARLASRAPCLSFRHWGDADVGGIRIWYYLRSRLRRPLALYRTTSDWILAEAAHGGKELTALEVAALVKIDAELAALDGADITAARAAVAAMLACNRKFEQERY